MPSSLPNIPNHTRLGTGIELHVPDFKLVLDFYQLFGFETVRTESNYLVMRCSDSAICFYGGSPEVVRHSYFSKFPATTKRGYGVEIIIPVDDITNLYERVKGQVKIVAPLTLRHWGSRDFRVEDPFGYYLRFTEK